jgi:teichuronic acid biosynthesis glycosyltransferase TuaG
MEVLVNMEYGNNNSSLVSIIMPTYNQAEYIKAAIDSALRQSYSIFELIIIDNYSTDATADVVLSYHDPRIKYLKFDNKGVIAAARNHGVKHANGAILAFLDSDDIWLPELLSVQKQLLTSDVALVSSSFEPIGNTAICRHHLNYIHVDEIKILQYQDIINSNPIMTSSVMLYKVDFDHLGGFDESLSFKFIEDWELWLRLAVNKNVLINGAKLLQYRISSKTDRDLRDVKKRTLLIMKKHFELNYINESMYKGLQGNCYVDIGKAYLDMNDRSGVKYYLKGAWAARSVHHKARSFAGLTLFCTPLFIRSKLLQLFYKFNSVFQK